MQRSQEKLEKTYKAQATDSKRIDDDLRKFERTYRQHMGMVTERARARSWSTRPVISRNINENYAHHSSQQVQKTLAIVLVLNGVRSISGVRIILVILLVNQLQHFLVNRQNLHILSLTLL